MRGRGTVVSLPRSGEGRRGAAEPGWGRAKLARSEFEAALPHPDGFAIVPPHEGEGERIVAAARLWLGTPYRHQASARGVGADCLGLVRGVWREVAGREPEEVPAYSADWAEVGGEETLLMAARRWLVEVPLKAMRAGDVVLFRMAAGAPAKHCAILSDAGGTEPKMIHAYWGRAVVESWMGEWWRRRLVAAFRFPGSASAGGLVGRDDKEDAAWRRSF